MVINLDFHKIVSSSVGVHRMNSVYIVVEHTFEVSLTTNTKVNNVPLPPQVEEDRSRLTIL